VQRSLGADVVAQDAASAPIAFGAGLGIDYLGVSDALRKQRVNQGLVGIELARSNAGSATKLRPTTLQGAAYRALRTTHLRGDLSRVAPFASHLAYHDPALTVEHGAPSRNLTTQGCPTLDREDISNLYLAVILHHW